MLLAVAVLAVPLNLSLGDVVDINEAQRLLPALEMRERGDWVVPTVDGDIYLAKPPLIYWMIAAADAAAGSDSALAGRVAVAVVCLLTAFAVLVAGRRWGGARVGFWAALILLSNFYFRDRAQTAQIDPVLTGAVFGLVYWQWRAAISARWLPAAVAAGLFAGCALLLKGPVALPFLAASTGAIWYAVRPPGRRLVAITAVALGLGLALFAPWALLLIRRVGADAVWVALRSEGLERVRASSPINTEPAYFYVPAVGVTFLPWSWLFALEFSRGFRAFAGERTRTPGGSLFRVAGVFAAASLGLFSLSIAKEIKYLLPIFPFLALRAGLLLEWVVTSPEPAARRAALAGLGALAALCVAGPVMYLTSLRPWVIVSPGAGALVAAATAAGVLALALLRRGRRAAAAVVLAAALAAGIATAQDALKRRGNALISARPLVPALEALARERVPVYRLHVGRVGAYYYRSLSRKLPETAPAEVLRADPSPALALVTEGLDPAPLALGVRDRPATISRRVIARGRYVLLTLRDSVPPR